jgi:hypothetical protein
MGARKTGGLLLLNKQHQGAQTTQLTGGSLESSCKRREDNTTSERCFCSRPAGNHFPPIGARPQKAPGMCRGLSAGPATGGHR